MKRIILLLACMVLAPSAAQAAGLYRWVDTNGKVHYGDMPPAKGAQVEALKFPAAAAPAEDLPYETRRARQNFPVTLYVADNCVELCDRARKLLSQRGIPYTEKRLSTQQDIDAFKALSGFDSTPALSVGRTFLNGFLASQWHDELDMAGYPKNAPYRPPAARPDTLPASAPAVTNEAVSASPPAVDQAAPATPPTP